MTRGNNPNNVREEIEKREHEALVEQTRQELGVLETTDINDVPHVQMLDVCVATGAFPNTLIS
jgi:hypothetical protein